MNIIQLTPGAGSMHCGGCMRDNAVVAAMRKMGHDALLVPLYTPLTTDEPDNSISKVFFGGLNVFLQQKSSLFRHTPRWLDDRLDHPSLLNFASSFAVKTRPEELGSMMLSMLRGEDGFQAKELDKLIEFLEQHQRPDVISLSNALLAGFARKLRQRLNVPIVCTLQGEDSFLDSLPGETSAQAWALLKERCADISAFIAVSNYYGGVMRSRLDLPTERVHAVLNGIELAGYAPAAKPPTNPTIGFLSHLIPPKGLPLLVDAFKRVRAKLPEARLRLAGSMPAGSREYVERLKAQVQQDGLGDAVDFLPNLDRAQKVAFLQSLSVLSVPATYGEAFGLYILEALACGVPVVQPRSGAFPEVLEATGGGVLCDATPDDLAAKLEELLRDEPRRKALGTGGRARVMAHFSIERVTKEVLDVFSSEAARGNAR